MAKLPERFAEVEQKWGEWIIEEEADRANLRIKKSTEELVEFYNDVQPHAREYIAYLDGFDINNLPADAKNLWWFLASFIGVAAAVEMYGSVKKIPGVELIGEFRPIGMRNEHELMR